MSGHWVKVTEIRVRCDLQKASSDAMAPVAVALPLFNSSKTRSDPVQKLAYDRHPSSCHHSRVSRSTTGADWAMLTPPLGRRGALRLGRPYESPAQGSLTRSRSSPSPGQCLPFSETVSPPILPSPSVSQTRPLRRGDYVLRPKQCLKAETQNVPIRFASPPLHLRSVVAFHGARYLREHVRPWAWHRPSGRPRQP